MLELSKEKYKIDFVYHGFKESDLPSYKLKSVQESFIEMHNAYAKWCRETNLFEKLTEEYKNTHYKAYPFDKWESLDGYMYGTWMAYQINKRLRERDISYRETLKDIGLDDWDLQPIILMDGSFPIFGVAFRNHLGWTMEMNLVEVQE